MKEFDVYYFIPPSNRQRDIGKCAQRLAQTQGRVIANGIVRVVGVSMQLDISARNTLIYISAQHK